MATIQQLRDSASYLSGYLYGRSFAVPHSLSDAYALFVSKATSFITLPLPLLSFLALPFYGGSSATISLFFFYLTWSALVISHDPLVVEIYGTLTIRLLFFLVPSLGFLAFDVLFPSTSRNVKARGGRQLPHALGRNKLLWVAGVAAFNVFLSVVVQALMEQVTTRALHLRSLVRVTTFVPLPWSIFVNMLKGFVVRGVLHYVVHRFVLHTYDSVLKSWHLSWQHSVTVPFSIVAAFDHPVNYLLAVFLPTFAPAVLFRWHVLEWHLFLTIVSVEELLIYSGYSALPSRIILSGMARRMEAHFDCVRKAKPTGNYGHLGVIDFVVGTTCKDEVDILDDVQDEAEKHRLQQRIDDAVSAALAKKGGDGESDVGKTQAETRRASGSKKTTKEEDQEYVPPQEDGVNGSASDGAPRRRGRRKMPWGRKD